MLLITIVCKPVLPVLQRMPEVADVVRRTVWPVQMVVGPEAVMVGGETVSVETVTLIGSDDGDGHPLVKVCTV